MRYSRAYRDLFTTSHWPLNLLAATLCQAVPVVGLMVSTGYAFEVLDRGEQHADGAVPVFDRDRVGAYLWRGLWPVIVQLLAVLPVLLVAWIAALVLVAVIAGHPPKPAVGARVSLALLFPLVLGAVTVLSVPLAPVTLYAGLRQEVSGAMTPFVQDFLLRVGKETLLAQLFIASSGTALVVLGSMFLCVALFPALAVVHLAQYHLLGQLYRLYLERGGTRLETALVLHAPGSAPENP